MAIDAGWFEKPNGKVAGKMDEKRPDDEKLEIPIHKLRFEIENELQGKLTGSSASTLSSRLKGSPNPAQDLLKEELKKNTDQPKE